LIDVAAQEVLVKSRDPRGVGIARSLTAEEEMEASIKAQKRRRQSAAARPIPQEVHEIDDDARIS
jgi:hypothetical protein